MKHILIYLLLFTASYSFAQNYIVYSAIGDVSICTNGQYNTIEKSQKLTGNSYIKIAEGGYLIVINQDEKKLCTIKTVGEGSITSLLSETGNRTQSLTESYFTYIIDKMKSGGKENPNTYMQSAGTTYRDIDSTTMNNLFKNE